MGWRIVEINKNCSVKLFLNNLIISGESNISIPINDIDVILFTNCRINVSINLLNELASNNVCIFFCNEKYLPTSMLFPIIGNLLTLKIFNDQINWTEDFKGTVWKKIVELKCHNQIKYLRFLNKINTSEFEYLRSFIEGIENFDITNREGHIAKIYWHKLFGVGFSRDDDLLTINKLLNYGYTVLNGMVARSIIKKGLDCRVSIFHKSVHNHFALSSDLIEPFRNVVDILVIELLNRNIIDSKTNDLTIEIKEVCLNFIADFKIMINGLYHQLNNAIDLFVDSLVNKSIFDIHIEYTYNVETNKKDNYFVDEEKDKEE
ncbi:MAG: type II CRISPR-associated endonuclease Cas1 [Malacoplasma sp.]|nr:type II CRISPR-associated endonuclease Cas1 [Malacoplasma sp.]